VQQVKLFKGLESDVEGLEKEINDWLSEAGVKVTNMFGNISPQTVRPEAGTGGGLGRSYAPSDILIVVLYE